MWWYRERQNRDREIEEGDAYARTRRQRQDVGQGGRRDGETEKEVTK